MVKWDYYFALPFVFLIFTACSKDDDSPIYFKDLTATKAFSFIEGTITITIDAQEFTDITTSSTNPKVMITEVNATTYTIGASEAATTTINVQLKNNGNTETKSIDLSFYEHGIKNFSVVEGIEISVDNADKIRTLMGEPEGKEDSASGEREYWYYFSKGFSFLINKTTTVADESRLYGIEWKRTLNGNEKLGNHYQHEISKPLIIANGQVQMDAIINKLGQPDEKHVSATTGSPLKWYVFNEGVKLFFNSDSIDDYTGKAVLYIDIF
tara:strand:+ start:43331 stop:44134 length:804 start_codon:yes stop_codon:yes gene_type:complete